MARKTRLSIAVPADFWLPSAFCSYGYFLLAPNRWRPRSLALERAFNAAEFGLPHEATTATIDQPSGRGGALRVRCDRPISRGFAQTLRKAAVRMLRVDKDLRHWRRLNPAAYRRGFGRMSRSPTLFEDMVKTITNCNVGWKSTVRMNRLLVDRVGRGSFPTADQLAAMTPSRLQKRCGVGYRAKRIVGLARGFRSGAIEPDWLESPDRSLEELRDYLLDLDGFGPYAAANVLQLLGHDDEVPIDTESYRLYCKATGVKRPSDPKRLDGAILARYEPFRPHRFLAYWYELWRDYESQRGDAWRWDPEAVGASFTAAELE